MASGNGMEIIRVCLNLVKEHGMKDCVQGLFFNTTVSNTGIHTGACVSLEKGLKLGLVGGLDARGRGWGLVGWFECWWVLMEWVGGWLDGFGASGMGWELMG